MSDGLATKYGEEARTVLRARSEELFGEYNVKLNVIISDVVVQGDSACDYGCHANDIAGRLCAEPGHPARRLSHGRFGALNESRLGIEATCERTKSKICY